MLPPLLEMAMERLRESPYKAMRRVSCECKHGVLFLRGRLFSFHEKQVAQEVVAGVSGVTQVVNEIASELTGREAKKHCYEPSEGQEEPCPRKKERPMLVLSRKLNESIVINYDVVVTVLGIRGESCDLASKPPGEIPVHRQEVHCRIQKQDVPKFNPPLLPLGL